MSLIKISLKDKAFHETTVIQVFFLIQAEKGKFDIKPRTPFKKCIKRPKKKLVYSVFL